MLFLNNFFKLLRKTTVVIYLYIIIIYNCSSYITAMFYCEIVCVGHTYDTYYTQKYAVCANRSSAECLCNIIIYYDIRTTDTKTASEYIYYNNIILCKISFECGAQLFGSLYLYNNILCVLQSCKVF